LIVIFSDGPQKLRLQGFFERGIPQIGVRVRSKGAGLHISGSADVYKASASRQATTNLLFITGDRNTQAAVFRAK
jgi:hypothetical protein